MNKDLTVGKPSQVLWQFCLPMFGSIIFQQLYNIADSLVAGKFIGENALAAVGNSYEITLIFIAFAFGCNIGCSVIVSRYFGAKDYDEMKTSVYTSLIGSAVLCAVLMLIGLVGCHSLLELINTPEEILADSSLYLDIYVLGLPFMFFYNIATGIFSALGDSKTPFYFLAVSSLSNIGVDILFVAGLKMGVAGVAWATFLCQGVSCVLAMVARTPTLSRIRKGLELVKVRAVDATGALELTFFNQAYLKDALRPGESYVFYGRVEAMGRRRSMTNPVFEREGAGEITGRILPVYPLTAGLTNRLLGELARRAVEVCAPRREETIPEAVRLAHRLCQVEYAYQNIHFPRDFEALAIARRRMIFEELLCLTCGMALLKRRRGRGTGRRFARGTAEEFVKLLPFAPTGAQRRAMEQLLYHLGRWIYLVDAWDDLDEDRKAGRYNPLDARFCGRAREERAYVETTLTHSLRLVSSAASLLSFGGWAPVVENILYSGLPAVQSAVLDGRWRELRKQKVGRNTDERSV